MLDLKALPKTSTISTSDRKVFEDYLLTIDPAINKSEIQELNAYSDEDIIVAFTGQSKDNEWQLDIENVEDHAFLVGIWRTSLQTPCPNSEFYGTDTIRRMSK